MRKNIIIKVGADYAKNIAKIIDNPKKVRKMFMI